MKTFVDLLAVVALAAAFSAGPTWADQKAPPSAFGKELVPDRSAHDYKGPDAEIEEGIEEEKEERDVERPGPRRGGGSGGRAGRVHIELDGDEDGGGGSLDGDF